MRKRGKFYRLGLSVALAFASLLQPVMAADYPQKPITFVVPYPAGGVTDVVGRLFAQVFSKHIKQPAIIMNKPGAGTVLGIMEVINASPDGYTLLLTANALVAAHYVLPDTVELWKELEPVGLFNLDPTTMNVSKKSGFESLKEIIAFAKKNPKRLSVGINQGTSTALYTFAFMKIAGIDVTYVPYKGGGDAKVALAGGHIDVHFDAPITYKPLVDAQKARFVGISTESRNIFFSDIPTFKEQGVNISWDRWNGIFAPKGTSAEIIQILEKAIEKTTNDKELLDAAIKNQITIRYKNRQEYIRHIEKEDKSYWAIATEIGLKLKK